MNICTIAKERNGLDRVRADGGDIVQKSYITLEAPLGRNVIGCGLQSDGLRCFVFNIEGGDVTGRLAGTQGQ